MLTHDDLVKIQEAFGEHGLGIEEFVQCFSQVIDDKAKKHQRRQQQQHHQTSGALTTSTSATISPPLPPQTADNLRLRWSDDALRNLFREVDYDGDESMTWDEFTSFAIATAMTGKVAADSRRDPGFKDYLLTLETLAEQGKQLRSLLAVRGADKLIACGFTRTTVHETNTPTFACLGDLDHHQGEILDAVYVPQMTLYICSSDQNTLLFYDATASGFALKKRLTASRAITRFMLPPTNHAYSLRVFCGDREGNVRILSLEKLRSSTGLGTNTVTALETLSARPHEDAITGMEVVTFPTGHAVLTCSLDNTIRSLDMETLTVLHEFRSLHERYTKGLSFSDYHRMCLSHGRDTFATLYLVDNPAAAPVKLIDHAHPHTHPLVSAFFVPCTNQIITADGSGLVKVWDVRQNTCRHSFHCPKVENLPLELQGKQVSSLIYCENSKKLISCGKQVSVFQYDLAQSELTAHSEPLVAVLYNPITETILTCSTKQVRVWNVQTGAAVAQFDQVVEPGVDITCLAYDTVQGRRFFVGRSDGHLAAFLAITGRELWRHEVKEGTPVQFCFMYTKRAYLIGLVSGEVYRWLDDSAYPQTLVHTTCDETIGLSFFAYNIGLALYTTSSSNALYAYDCWGRGVFQCNGENHGPQGQICALTVVHEKIYQPPKNTEAGLDAFSSMAELMRKKSALVSRTSMARLQQGEGALTSPVKKPSGSIAQGSGASPGRPPALDGALLEAAAEGGHIKPLSRTESFNGNPSLTRGAKSSKNLLAEGPSVFTATDQTPVSLTLFACADAFGSIFLWTVDPRKVSSEATQCVMKLNTPKHALCIGLTSNCSRYLVAATDRNTFVVYDLKPAILQIEMGLKNLNGDSDPTLGRTSSTAAARWKFLKQQRFGRIGSMATAQGSISSPGMGSPTNGGIDPRGSNTTQLPSIDKRKTLTFAHPLGLESAHGGSGSGAAPIIDFSPLNSPINASSSVSPGAKKFSLVSNYPVDTPQSGEEDPLAFMDQLPNLKIFRVSFPASGQDQCAFLCNVVGAAAFAAGSLEGEPTLKLYTTDGLCVGWICQGRPNDDYLGGGGGLGSSSPTSPLASKLSSPLGAAPSNNFGPAPLTGAAHKKHHPQQPPSDEIERYRFDLVAFPNASLAPPTSPLLTSSKDDKAQQSGSPKRSTAGGLSTVVWRGGSDADYLDSYGREHKDEPGVNLNRVAGEPPSQQEVMRRRRKKRRHLLKHQPGEFILVPKLESTVPALVQDLYQEEEAAKKQRTLPIVGRMMKTTHNIRRRSSVSEGGAEGVGSGGATALDDTASNASSAKTEIPIPLDTPRQRRWAALHLGVSAVQAMMQLAQERKERMQSAAEEMDLHASRMDMALSVRKKKRLEQSGILGSSQLGRVSSRMGASSRASDLQSSPSSQHLGVPTSESFSAPRASVQVMIPLPTPSSQGTSGTFAEESLSGSDIGDDELEDRLASRRGSRGGGMPTKQKSVLARRTLHQQHQDEQNDVALGGGPGADTGAHPGGNRRQSLHIQLSRTGYRPPSTNASLFGRQVQYGVHAKIDGKKRFVAFQVDDSSQLVAYSRRATQGGTLMDGAPSNSKGESSESSSGSSSESEHGDASRNSSRSKPKDSRPKKKRGHERKRKGGKKEKPDAVTFIEPPLVSPRGSGADGLTSPHGVLSLHGRRSVAFPPSSSGSPDTSFIGNDPFSGAVSKDLLEMHQAAAANLPSRYKLGRLMSVSATARKLLEPASLVKNSQTTHESGEVSIRGALLAKRESDAMARKEHLQNKKKERAAHARAPPLPKFSLHAKQSTEDAESGGEGGGARKSLKVADEELSKFGVYVSPPSNNLSDPASGGGAPPALRLPLPPHIAEQLRGRVLSPREGQPSVGAGPSAFAQSTSPISRWIAPSASSQTNSMGGSALWGEGMSLTPETLNEIVRVVSVAGNRPGPITSTATSVAHTATKPSGKKESGGRSPANPKSGSGKPVKDLSDTTGAQTARHGRLVTGFTTSHPQQPSPSTSRGVRPGKSL